MGDLLDDGSFMFTSESVGEGHPGESLISLSVTRNLKCTEEQNVRKHFKNLLHQHTVESLELG